MIIRLKYVRINVYSFCFYITGDLMLYKGRMTFVKIKKRVIAKYIWRNQNKYISCGIDVKKFGIILALSQIISLITGKSYYFKRILGERKYINILYLELHYLL